MSASPKEVGTALRPRVQSAARTVEILQAVARHRGHGISAKELAESLRLPRQVVYHLVHTLVSTSMLRKASGSRYMLGLGVAVLAHGFRRQLADSDWPAALVQEAARVTGETAEVLGWMGEEIVVIAAAAGRLPAHPEPSAPGTIDSAHARAPGKLLLALATDAEIEGYLQLHPLQPRTSHTLIDPGQWLGEIHRIRCEAAAYDHEEYLEGISCMAVPIGEPPLQLALGLCAPSVRLQPASGMYLDQLRAITAGVSAPPP